jgi:hypothetical protein
MRQDAEFPAIGQIKLIGKRKRAMTCLTRPVRDAEPDLVCLGEPPETDVFARGGELVQPIDRLVQADGLADLLEMERGLNLQGDGYQQASAPETAEGGHEEIRVLSSGASDDRSVRQEQLEGEHMRRNHTELDA